MNRALLVALVLAPVLAPRAVSQVAFQPAVAVNVPGLVGPRATAAGDLDGDHDLDLAVAFGTSNAVAILINDGSGGFTLAASVGVGAGPRAVVLADLDGDGDLDAATADEGGSTVSVVWNGGAGWSAGPVLPCGAGPRSLLAADLDGDGAIDLVSANTTANTISVILGQPGGTFAPAISLAAGASPREVASGHFNGDGHRDLVVTAASSNQVLLFPGLGSGTFGAPVGTPASGTLAIGLATGDVDGDGDLDVVTSSFLAPSLTVYVNDGAGAFTTSSFALGTHVQDVVLADFDFDGDLDAAGLDVSTNVVRVAQNTGAGGFAPGQQVAVGASTSTLIQADLDGDYVPDLVTSDAGAGLSILVNALPDPVMGPAGAGTTPDGAGGLFDGFLLNGTRGGVPRRVDAAMGSTLWIDVLTPPLATSPAPFLIWGTLGVPSPVTETALPLGIGTLAFAPWHLAPGNPDLFVLANGFFPDSAATVAPPPTPWTASFVLPQFPITATLQGLVQDAGGLRITNGIILRVQ
jgi:FG-GAP-like repeat